MRDFGIEPSIDWQHTRYEGIAVHFYSSDTRSRRVLALIRMQPGCGYPPHRHRASEQVLVLQGAYRDEFGTHEAGSFATYPAGSEHAPVAFGDRACVLLALAHEGVQLLR